MARARIGIWLIGAKGGVASTATVGLTALKKGLIGDAGLVSELPEFQSIGLAPWSDFVVGGHEIRDVRSFDEAMRMHTESRAIDSGVLAQCKDELDEIDGRIRPGVVLNVGPTIEKLASPEVLARRETPRQAIERVQADLKAFTDEHQLEHVLVVNVSSTEPAVNPDSLPPTWKELNELIDEAAGLPAAGQFAVCHCGARPGLLVHQLHAFARFGGAGHRRVGAARAVRGTWGTTARRARRCSRACWPRCSPRATWRS